MWTTQDSDQTGDMQADQNYHWVLMSEGMFPLWAVHIFILKPVHEKLTIRPM